MCLIFLVKSRMVVWSDAFEACCHKVGLGSSTPFSSSWASWWFIENFFPSNTTIWVHLISVRIRSPCFCLVDSKWPADSPSVSTQVWRRLLGQYHPRTRHSLAGLWGLARESWESVQQNGLTPTRHREGAEGACHPVLCCFGLLLSEALPQEEGAGLPVAEALLLVQHSLACPSFHDIGPHGPPALSLLWLSLLASERVCFQCGKYILTTEQYRK